MAMFESRMTPNCGILIDILDFLKVLENVRTSWKIRDIFLKVYCLIHY